MADPVRSVATTSVEAAVAALESDPADQGSAAHVATLRSAWNTLVAGLGGIPATADAVLSYDETAINNLSVLDAAIRALQLAAHAGSGLPR